MISRKAFAELADSFPSEEHAREFAIVFQGRTGGEFTISQLITHTGGKTDWYRLAVPSKLLARAEDIRHGWELAYYRGWDRLHGKLGA